MWKYADIYLPQSLENIVLPEISTELSIYQNILGMIDALTQSTSHMEHSKIVLDDMKAKNLFEKLSFIKEDIGSRAVTFALLSNIPNVTFDELFEALGPTLKETVWDCYNAGIQCTNFTQLHLGHFPKCFDYAVVSPSNTVSDEGISNGLTLILMNGAKLASLAFKRYRSDLYYHFPGFQNTLEPFSAEGIRLLFSSPGIMPDIDKKGITINPGHATLLALTGKETIRLPWPYSDCTFTDFERLRLWKTVANSLGETASGKEEHLESRYTQNGCHSACLLRLIWEECHCLDLHSTVFLRNLPGKLICGTLTKAGMKRILYGFSAYFNCYYDLNYLISDECSFLHKMINELACVRRVKQEQSLRKLQGKSECNCPPACHSYEYEITTSDSPWPAPGPETHSAYIKLDFIQLHYILTSGFTKSVR